MADLKKLLEEFMADYKSPYVIGLDIGAHSIKACVLNQYKKNKWELTHFGMSQNPEAVIIEDEIQRPDEVTLGIVKAIEKSGANSKLVCIGMFGPNTMTKKISSPDDDDDIESQMLYEAEQYVPFGVDDSVMELEILGQTDQGIYEGIVAAVKTDIVNSFVKTVQDAGYIVKIVDLSVLSLNNIFELIMGEDAAEQYSTGTILIDFGAQYTRVVVYRGGCPIVTKEVNLGGANVTEEIQRQMGVSYEEAEDLKCFGDQEGNLPEEVLAIVDIHLENLMNELRKVLNFYIAIGSTERAEYCFITGGSSQLPGLPEILQEVIEIEVQVLNPFETIRPDKKFKEEMLHQISIVGPIVMGLALREV